MQRSSPAAQRNKGALLDVLRQVLPPTGLVLELASGTGEHAAFFARALPALTWQPSDPAEEARASIDAWRAAESLANLLVPINLDATTPVWGLDHADALLCINMVHISPWSATEGLMQAAGQLLPADGPLVLYGPFIRAGVTTAASNVAFDQDLRRRNPAWGLRQLEQVTALALKHDLRMHRVVDMPANNLTVVFRRP